MKAVCLNFTVLPVQVVVVSVSGSFNELDPLSNISSAFGLQKIPAENGYLALEESNLGVPSLL